MCRNEADFRRRGTRTSDLKRGLSRGALCVLVLVMPLGLARPAAASVTVVARPAGIEITSPVRQALQRLAEQWLQWMNAPNRERSEGVIDELLATAHELGMARLPDLSSGALNRAVEAARRRDFTRAGWSLAAAERLDPGRPDAAFAVATVARLQGDYPRLVASLARAWPRFVWLPLQRYLWLQDLLLWGLCLLLVTGGLFVGVLMATRGGGLCHDLVELLARRLPRPAALAAAALLLLWPLLLPGGLLWLPVFWSLLLWGYASPSQRAVLIALWLTLGAAPVVVGQARRHVSVALSPPVRAMESLRQKRLYGGLYVDLGELRALLPESPAVKHLLADVHRSLNQWELARSFYRQVVEAEPQNAPALINLGVYSFYKGDFPGAIQYFEQAAAADPRSALAQYDRSQAYSESYMFDEMRRARVAAKLLDDAQVDEWSRNVDQQRVVPADGGLARVPEIERALLASSAPREAAAVRLELVRQARPLAVSLVLILLAVALHFARLPFGYTSSALHWRLGARVFDRARRVLVPGLSSAESGEGARSFMALLAPAALLMLPLFEQLGYRMPWGYDPGNGLAWIVAIGGLLLFLGGRLLWELRNAV